MFRTVANPPGVVVRCAGCVRGIAGLVLVLTLAARVAAQERVVVEFESEMRYLANASDPGLAMTWVAGTFDDSGWATAPYGVGYETGTGAQQLVLTPVPPGSLSVYTRVEFQVADPAQVTGLHLGSDYDDAYVAWINGVEIARSPEVPPGPLAWSIAVGAHESSNGLLPAYAPLIDVSAAGLPALAAGTNVLVVAVWNTGPSSSDLVLVPLLVVNPAVALTRRPYLQLGTPTSVEIRWRTATPTDSRVDFGLDPSALTSTVTDAAPKTEHGIPLTGLTPGTRYYYGVGSASGLLVGGDADHTFVTPPVAGTPQATRVWVLGDSGTGTVEQARVRDAYYLFTDPTPTDLWLLLGDNAYPSGTDAEYQTKFFDIYPEMLRTSVVWPTLGNHDGVSADSATETGPYYDIFRLPRSGEAGGLASGTEAYYSFDHANLHFVVLDSHETDRSPTGAMLTWLDLDLASTMQDWIVAFWHHPPYSKGSHNSDVESELIEMRTNAVPILEAHGADLVLTGHSHSYERSFLLDGHYGLSSTLVPSMLLDAGDGRETGDGAYQKPALGAVPRQGAVQVVAGSSGQASGGPLDHPAMFLSLNVLGSLVLDFEGNRLDLRFLDDLGATRDSLTIVKGCADRGAFGSIDDSTGNASYVYTPGLCDSGPPCGSDLGTSISSSFRGSFWRMGLGSPLVGAGLDSGAWPAIESDDRGWVRFDAGQPAFLDGDWAFDRRVDGCLGDAPGPRCLVVALADQDGASGYLALLSARESPGGTYLFDEPAAAPIRLGVMPRPFLASTSKPNPYTVVVNTAAYNVPSNALHLDEPDCSANAAVGYRVYAQKTERSAPAPADRTRDDGNPVTGWELAPGGAGPGGQPLPLGSTASVSFTCHTVKDVFLAASFAFDSGFETPYVSRNSSRIFCGTCATDDDTDGFCGEVFGGGPGPLDCDDQNAQVAPGAAQLCGDGRNNDCNHPAWPALTGTNEADDDGDGVTECAGDCDDANPALWGIPGEARNLAWAGDHSTLSWDAPVQPGGSPAAVVYDVLRATGPQAFGAATCVESNDGADRLASDNGLPSASDAFHYLIRAESACGAGTLGTNSFGTPRTGATCP